MSKIFSWPYPKNLKELVQVVAVCFGLLFVGLTLTAMRYQSYKNHQLTEGDITQATSSLVSFTTEASQVNHDALEQKVTNNFRSGYNDQLSHKVEDVVQYVNSRSSSQEILKAASKLVLYGQRLQATLQQGAQPILAETQLRQIWTSLQRLDQQLQAMQEEL